jgi:hypothetical protein
MDFESAITPFSFFFFPFFLGAIAQMLSRVTSLSIPLSPWRGSHHMLIGRNKNFYTLERAALSELHLPAGNL